MRDAFGIEKSMVGGEYIPATKLTSGARKIIGRRAAQKVAAPGKKVEGQSAKGRTVYPDGLANRSMNRKIHTDVLAPVHHLENGKLHPMGTQLLGHSQPNGKGGGVLRMNPHAPDQEATYKHEMAHLTPKRNPVRFFERTSSDPKRLGREEGRADYTANKKKTPGSYPGSQEFQHGYNQVQDKMHRASKLPKKPRKFAVDSQGTAVQKSAFGVDHVSKARVRVTAPKHNKRVLIHISRGGDTATTPNLRAVNEDRDSPRNLREVLARHMNKIRQT